MEIQARIMVDEIEVRLHGKGSVTASCKFKIGNIPVGYGNTFKVSVPMTDELRKYIENVVTAQVGEIISRDAEDETNE